MKIDGTGFVLVSVFSLVLAGVGSQQDVQGV